MQTESISIQAFALWRKTRQKHIPTAFDLELTARCNLNCRHCYINLPAGDSEAISRELAAGEILRIAKQAVDLGAIWCNLTGGEPLLRPDFNDIFIGLKRLGLLVSIYTNATLVREEEINLFRKFPPRDIEITVYGTSKETYERVTRIPGSYSQFKRGLEFFLKEKIPVRLKAMVLRSNLDEFNQIADFCRKHTKDYYRFDPLLNLRIDRDRTKNVEIMAERLSPVEIARLEQKDPERFPALLKNCDHLIKPVRSELTYEECASCADHENCEQFDRATRLILCGAGTNNFYIAHDGFFRICASLCAPGTTVNLRRKPLKKAWTEFSSKLRERRIRNGEMLKKCHFCPIINLCMNCPAHVYLENGNLEGVVEYFCAVAHERQKKLDEAKKPPILHSKQKSISK